MIDIKGKKVEYLDSLHGGDRTCLEMLAQYITDEAQHKRGQVLDTTAWPRSFPRDATPRQLNGCDCGVFTVKFADYLARGRPLDFTQENMPYFRQRIVAEVRAGAMRLCCCCGGRGGGDGMGCVAHDRAVSTIAT